MYFSGRNNRRSKQQGCSRLVFRSLGWTENIDSLPDRSMEVQAVTAR